MSSATCTASMCFVKLLLVGLVWVVQHGNAQKVDGKTFGAVLENLADRDLGVEKFQKHLDKVNFVKSLHDGNVLVATIAEALTEKFRESIAAVTSLHELITKEYGSFEKSSYIEIPDCCNGDLHTYDPRFKTEVNDAQVCTSGKHTPTKFVTTKVIDAMRRNLIQNKHLRWQYFGSEDGVITTYPSLRQCAPEFDPRFRPWYVLSITPRPKDVVIVIDTSGSMSKDQQAIAKDIVDTVITTFGQNDRGGIVSFSNVTNTPPGTKQTSTCYSTTLAKSTPQNKAYLKQYVSELMAGGKKYYAEAFEKAFELMASVDDDGLDMQGRDKVILFLSDGKPNDRPDKIYDTIRTKNAELHNEVVIHTYGIGDALDDEPRELLQRLANQSDHDRDAGEIRIGVFTVIGKDAKNSMRQIMGSYYNFFSQAGQIPPVALVVPYIDAFGLGLVTSACMPVHYQSTLVGVVCVDITVGDPLSDITYLKEGELSYAFMIDDRARLRIHPLLPQPYTAEDDAIYVDMLTLESFQGADEVMNSMLRGDINHKNVSSRRVISRGKVVYEGVKTATVDSTYYWHPVGGTEFSVCLVIADADRRIVVESYDFDRDFTCHRLDVKLKSEEVCNYHSRTLALRDRSSVQFTSKAFSNPYHYLEEKELENDIQKINLYMTGNSNIDPGFKPGLRESVSITAELDHLWTTAGQSNYVIWRYIGTEDGIFRVMPGSSQNKDYDHTHIPWYKRALSQKGRLVLSTPYKDNLGAGYVLTLSKTVYEGRATGDPPGDVVIGVISIDFTMAFVFNRLSSFSVCEDDPNRCFIIETSGFIIIHNDFVKVDATKKPDVEYIHITKKEPHIAADLINKNVMTKSACYNFTTQRDQYFWSVHIINGSTVVTDGYEVHEVPNTNVFLVYIKGGSSNDCKCSEQKPDLGKCHKIDCECSCFVETKRYSYCQDFFNLTNSWPPCTQLLPNLAPDNSVEAAQAGSLAPCFNYSCPTKGKQNCTNSATCSWCSVYKDGSRLSDPFCADQDTCPYGVLDYVSSSSSSSNIPAIIGGTVGALLLLLVIVIGFTLCKSPKSQPIAQENNGVSTLCDDTTKNQNELHSTRSTVCGDYDEITPCSLTIPGESQSTQNTLCRDESRVAQDHTAPDRTTQDAQYWKLEIIHGPQTSESNLCGDVSAIAQNHTAPNPNDQEPTPDSNTTDYSRLEILDESQCPQSTLCGNVSAITPDHTTPDPNHQDPTPDDDTTHYSQLEILDEAQSMQGTQS